MKLPVSWLAEWVDIPWTADELARRLTMAGFEIEGLMSAAPAFSGVVVARILGAERHPQADKLQVCQVDAGLGKPLQIVCGAANARAGLVTALATVGAKLPGDVAIKAAKLRGIESAGMLCSARELGLAENSQGLLELPGNLTPGTDLRGALHLDDTILEINVTPNRGDAMSVLGIAREIGALTGQGLRAVASGDTAPDEFTRAATALHIIASPDVPQVEVTLQPGAGAGRLCARIIEGVNNRGASPLWLIERLRRAGLRSISPIVDVTNYVLLELGQPMHAYDRAHLMGGLAARRARADECLTLLDGVERRLAGDELVIADGAGVVGLAGILGGARALISPASTGVVLESAWFEPHAIAGRARRYGLTTDAGQRFERGVDPAGQERALERATQLILSICGGRAGPVTCAQLPDALPRRPAVTLRARQLQRLLGAVVPAAEVTSRLWALGLVPTPVEGGWSVSVPSWRFDIGIEADLVEEVVRIGGLDSIPEQDARVPVMLAPPAGGCVDEQRVMQTLSARGYWEAITFGFVDPALQAQLLGEQPAVRVVNPIASDLAVLRTSLWPGLVAAARENLRRQHPRVRLCEIAHRFTMQVSAADQGTVVAASSSVRPEPATAMNAAVGVPIVAGSRVNERKMLAGIAVGPRWPEQWGAAAMPMDFFDLRADLEAVLVLTGQGGTFSFEAAELPGLHPGRGARVLREGQAIGVIGELHPQLVRVLDFTYAPLLFEIDYEQGLRTRLAQFREISRFPQIRRDISITVREDVPFSLVRERVSVAAASLLKELRIFDVYQGAGIENGRKSIALGLILQDLSRTLTDDDADRLIGSVLADLQTTVDARIRE